MKDTNDYEVMHMVNISMELSDGQYKTISSTFKTIKAKSLSDAKKILDDATPKGKATMISENSNRSYKHTYIENVNEYIIKHIICINKNGIRYKDVNIDDSTDYQTTTTETGDINSNEEKEKPINKKSNTTRNKKDNSKPKRKNPSKSNSGKKSKKTKRTTVEYIKE